MTISRCSTTPSSNTINLNVLLKYFLHTGNQQKLFFSRCWISKIHRIEYIIESNLELNGWGESIESNLESNLWWIDENEWMNRGTVTLPVLELGDLHTVLITSTVHHLAVFARSEQTELKQIQIRFFAFGSWNGMHGMHGIIIKWFMPISGHSIKDICNKKARSSVRDGISTPITNIFQKHRHIAHLHTHSHTHRHRHIHTHRHTLTQTRTPHQQILIII